jgi:hypothetical protein
MLCFTPYSTAGILSVLFTRSVCHNHTCCSIPHFLPCIVPFSFRSGDGRKYLKMPGDEGEAVDPSGSGEAKGPKKQMHEFAESDWDRWADRKAAKFPSERLRLCIDGKGLVDENIRTFVRGVLLRNADRAPRLKSLSLEENEFTEAGVAELARGLSQARIKLEELQLRGNARITSLHGLCEADGETWSELQKLYAGLCSVSEFPRDLCLVLPKIQLVGLLFNKGPQTITLPFEVSKLPASCQFVLGGNEVRVAIRPVGAESQARENAEFMTLPADIFCRHPSQTVADIVEFTKLKDLEESRP